VNTTLAPILVAPDRRHKACGKTVSAMIQSYFSVQIYVIKPVAQKNNGKIFVCPIGVVYLDK